MLLKVGSIKIQLKYATVIYEVDAQKSLVGMIRLFQYKLYSNLRCTKKEFLVKLKSLGEFFFKVRVNKSTILYQTNQMEEILGNPTTTPEVILIPENLTITQVVILITKTGMSYIQKMIITQVVILGNLITILATDW